VNKRGRNTKNKKKKKKKKELGLGFNKGDLRNTKKKSSD
jgi:hypothetical protein